VVAQNETRIVLRILLVAPLIIFVLFLVASYFLSIPLGVALFFFTPEGSSVSNIFLPPSELPILLFMMFGVYIPAAINIGLVFLFLLGVYVVCFVGAWIFRESLHDVVKKSFSRPFTKLFNNNLFAMPIIASILFIAFIVIHVFLGVSTGPGPFEPSEDPLQPFINFFELTYSPLVEEVGFRISPIGIFLLVYLFLVGGKRVATLSGRERLKVLFLIPLNPDNAKKLLGVKTVREFGIRGVSLAEWVIIIFTSLAFGLAHPLLGSGWELGKAISTSMYGLAFGLAYMFYGAQAPILLHWSVNYYWYCYDLAFGDLVASLLVLMALIVGVLGWSMFAGLLGVRVYEKVKSWWYRRWKRAVPAPPLSTQLPPPTSSPPTIRFCRRCGRVLSEDMQFCPYCGKAFEEEA